MQQNKSRTVGAGHRDNANRLLAERYYVTFRLWHRPSCRLWRLCTLLGGLNFSVIFCTVTPSGGEKYCRCYDGATENARLRNDRPNRKSGKCRTGNRRTNLRLLEYNSVVWSPYYKQDIEAIERVQRRFSKRLPGLKEFTYEERLKFLGWPSCPRMTSPAYWLNKLTKFCLG